MANIQWGVESGTLVMMGVPVQHLAELRQRAQSAGLKFDAREATTTSTQQLLDGMWDITVAAPKGDRQELEEYERYVRALGF